MNGIKQGTTPEFTVPVPSEYPLSAANGAELVFEQDGDDAPVVIGTNDLTLDTTNNTVTYKFSEAETFALDATKRLKWELRLRAGTDIVATLIGSVRVYPALYKGAFVG